MQLATSGTAVVKSWRVCSWLTVRWCSERDAPAAEAGTGAGAGAGAGDAASAGSARRARRFYNIAVTDFVDEIAPTLSSNDCVVMLGLQRVRGRVRWQLRWCFLANAARFRFAGAPGSGEGCGIG